MSPVVTVSGREPQKASNIEVEVRGQFVQFEIDASLGQKPVAPEAQELNEQVLDGQFRERREALIAGLAGSQYCKSRDGLFIDANSARFFDRFAEELAALERLGYPPFAGARAEDPKRNFPIFDAQMKPVQGAVHNDSFANVTRQALASALFLDRLLDLANARRVNLLQGANFLPGFSRDEVVSMSLLSKALKPWEIIDRIALKSGALDASVRPDAHERLHAHMQRLVSAGLITQELGDKIYFVARHTVGREGMYAFLQRGQGQQFSINGNPEIQLVRACDDIRVFLPGGASGEVHVAASPDQKVIAISGRRGAGLFGDVLSFSAPGAPDIQITAAQAQDIISSCKLAEVAHLLGLHDPRGPVWAVIDAVEKHRLQQAQSQ
ncbi:MAG: hypothetical protein K1X79_04310 [Oligoflexia bacterium]|nr:hypothetical protein [Oligoflexia bacterium]